MLDFDASTSLAAAGGRPVAPEAAGQASPAGRGSAAGVVPRSSDGGESTALPRDLVADVDRLNTLIQHVRRELEFRIDEAHGRPVIRVIDADTREIVRQIPAEEVARLLEVLETDRASALVGLRA